MTIRKKLIITVFSIAILIVVISTFVSSMFIDDYFKGYILDQYDSNVNTLIEKSKSAILSEGFNNISRIDFAPYLEEPIIGISVYDANKVMKFTIKSDNTFMHNGMMGRESSISEKLFELNDNGQLIGYLMLDVKDSMTDINSILLFKSALMRGGVLSAILVLIISLVLIIFFSKKMTSDLVITSNFASEIVENRGKLTKLSNITEIKELQLVLVNLATKIKLQSRSRKEKADKIAHEARTPLTVLKTNIEGAIDGMVEMNNDKLKICLNHVDRLNDTITNITELIEYENDEIIVVKEKFDLAQEIYNLVDIMKTQYEKKKLGLNYIGPDKLEVNMDKGLINQCMYNLLSNSYKYSNDGNVTVKVTVEDNIIIKVIDEGMGINDIDINRVFSPYFRSYQAKDIQGDGLGLFITKKNIEAMGGSIEITKNKPKGTIFIITLKI